jgi:hypothetical protein
MLLFSRGLLLDTPATVTEIMADKVIEHFQFTFHAPNGGVA